MAPTITLAALAGLSNADLVAQVARLAAQERDATVENIELRCRAHNSYEAEHYFGPWGPSQVREPASVYATGRQEVGPRGTRFEPSWTSAGRPP